MNTWLSFILYSAVLLSFIAPTEVAATYCSIDKSQIQYCSNETVCMYTQRKTRKDLKVLATNEARRRGLGCTSLSNKHTKINTSPLRLEFTRLKNAERQKVQTVLSSKGYYLGGVDGLYGRKTAAAIEAFRGDYFPNLNSKKQNDAVKLLQQILILTPNARSEISSEENTTSTEVMVSSGTGFFISTNGNVVTNHHVIEGCGIIKASYGGKEYDLTLIADDQLNDLAVLNSPVTPKSFIALSSERPFPMQEIIVAGYPFGENYSSTIKFTKGIVSSLAGIGNNYSQIQIDAAIQPGNSGGPILDEYGNAIAVAVAKLSVEHVLDNYGVIPENTNFGVKASAVRNLLEGNNITSSEASDEQISKQNLANKVSEATLYLTCWMNQDQILRMLKKKHMFEQFTR